MTRINPWRILAILVGIALVLTSIYFNASGSSETNLPVDSALTSSSETQMSSSTVSATAPPLDYKQLMSESYQQTLQTMHDIKENTLALQGKKMSLSAYKTTILQSQATFAEVEAFVQANPPTEAHLILAYQDFLAGISLANQSMSFILSGISSFSLSDFYTARDMGRTAQQQVIKGYAQF